jgi:hypothetical protein
MPTVTILRREWTPGAPPGAPTEHAVAVTYSTPDVPPRSVLLPVKNYNPVTADELRANPRYMFLPKDQPAEEAERLAIRQDMDRALTSAPTRFEVP